MTKSYEGSPENYLTIDRSKGIDTDALMIALGRAESICVMLSANFDDTQDTLNNSILAYACSAIEGSINQAQIILSGRG